MPLMDFKAKNKKKGAPKNEVTTPIGTSTGLRIFLIFCDLIAKNILSPIEVPIGVVTAFFGAPFFLFLALKSVRGIR